MKAYQQTVDAIYYFVSVLIIYQRSSLDAQCET